MKHTPLLVAAMGLASAMCAQASITISVDGTMAPNAFGSPSYQGWIDNAAYAIANGLTTYGAAGPTQFNAVNNPLPSSENFVTGFPSWEGTADPTGLYSSELGTRASFVGLINGNGQEISIANLGLVATSTDPGNFLGNTWTGSLTYDNHDIGVIFNSDGSVTLVTSGPATQQVNEIISIHGNAPAGYTGDDPAPGATDQDTINYDLAQNPSSYDFTGTFTYGDAKGSATLDFTATPVPEPSTVLTGALLLLPIGLSAFRMARKARTA